MLLAQFLNINTKMTRFPPGEHAFFKKPMPQALFSFKRSLTVRYLCRNMVHKSNLSSKLWPIYKMMTGIGRAGYNIVSIFLFTLSPPRKPVPTYDLLNHSAVNPEKWVHTRSKPLVPTFIFLISVFIFSMARPVSFDASFGTLSGPQRKRTKF
jgi:hypothetical protein